MMQSDNSYTDLLNIQQLCSFTLKSSTGTFLVICQTLGDCVLVSMSFTVDFLMILVSPPTSGPLTISHVHLHSLLQIGLLQSSPSFSRLNL